MAIYKLEDVVGWENNNSREFFCCDCFDKEHQDDITDWTPIDENEEYLYICDDCHQRI